MFIIEKTLFLDCIAFHGISLVLEGKKEKRRNPFHYFRSERLHFPEKKKKKGSIDRIHKHPATTATAEEETIEICKILQVLDPTASSYPPTFFINTVRLLRAHLMAQNPVPSPLHPPHPFPSASSPTSLPSPYRTAHSPLPAHQAYLSSHYS